MQFRKSYTYILEKICNRVTLNMYSHGHGISSVVVIQLALAVKHVLYFYPTLEFLTYIRQKRYWWHFDFYCVTEILSQKF
jgi:hypothetical protein